MRSDFSSIHIREIPTTVQLYNYINHTGEPKKAEAKSIPGSILCMQYIRDNNYFIGHFTVHTVYIPQVVYAYFVSNRGY